MSWSVYGQCFHKGLPSHDRCFILRGKEIAIALQIFKPNPQKYGFPSTFEQLGHILADVGKKVLTLKYYLIRQVFLDNHTVVDMQCALKKLLGSRSSTNIWPGFLYCALLQFSRKILSRESVLVRKNLLRPSSFTLL